LRPSGHYACVADRVTEAATARDWLREHGWDVAVDERKSAPRLRGEGLALRRRVTSPTAMHHDLAGHGPGMALTQNRASERTCHQRGWPTGVRPPSWTTALQSPDRVVGVNTGE